MKLPETNLFLTTATGRKINLTPPRPMWYTKSVMSNSIENINHLNARRVNYILAYPRTSIAHDNPAGVLFLGGAV